MKVSIAGSLTQPTDKEEEGNGEPEPAKKETAAKQQKVSTTIQPLHEPADFQKFSTTIQPMLEPADLEEEEQEVQEAEMSRKFKVFKFQLIKKKIEQNNSLIPKNLNLWKTLIFKKP